MSEHTPDILKLLNDNPPAKEFSPYCHHSRESDSLTVYFAGDADYSESLSEQITLYRSLETKQIVGCRVHGVNALSGVPTSQLPGLMERVVNTLEWCQMALGDEENAVGQLGIQARNLPAAIDALLTDITPKETP